MYTRQTAHPSKSGGHISTFKKSTHRSFGVKSHSGGKPARPVFRGGFNNSDLLLKEEVEETKDLAVSELIFRVSLKREHK